MTWNEFIKQEGEKDYYKDLKQFIGKERETKLIHPESSKLFNSFKFTPFNKVRVVILGDEPYAATNYNDGLAWSSINSIRTRSLVNIFDEIINDWAPNFKNSNDKAFAGNSLKQWAEDGVLLLNAINTVEDGKAHSHKNKGWEQFTQNAISLLSKERDHLVFMLWGVDLQGYERLIDKKKHLILKSSSPRKKDTFSGNKHFTQCNDFMNKHYMNKQVPINWFLFKYK